MFEEGKRKKTENKQTKKFKIGYAVEDYCSLKFGFGLIWLDLKMCLGYILTEANIGVFCKSKIQCLVFQM